LPQWNKKTSFAKSVKRGKYLGSIKVIAGSTMVISRFLRAAALLALLLFVCSCSSILKKKEKPGIDGIDLESAVEKPLPPEKSEELLGEVGNNWLYGQGIGNTAATVGTVVLFPPYALLVLGNVGLEAAGYEPLWLSDALPAKGRQAWHTAYDGVTSGPGRLAASIAGREYRTPQVADQRVAAVLQSSNTPILR